jgi:hypothetical protein
MLLTPETYGDVPVNSRFTTPFVLLLLIAISASIMGLGRSDNEKPKTVKGKIVKDTFVQVTGKVRLVGNAPLTEIVISNAEREYYIEKSEQKKLWDMQQQIVTVQGEESSIELTFANGTSAGRRYTLSNIKILKKPPDFR